MRTTVELNDQVYSLLVQRSIELYGTARNLSRVMNDYLATVLLSPPKLKKKSMFGAFRDNPVSLSGLREKVDRVDKW